MATNTDASLAKNVTNFEDYLIWFFTTDGVYFFVFDGNDRFLKEINKVDDIQED